MSPTPPPGSQASVCADKTIDISRLDSITDSFDMFKANRLWFGSDDLAFDDTFSNLDFDANLMPEPHVQQDAVSLQSQGPYVNGSVAVGDQHLTSRTIFGLEYLRPMAGMTRDLDVQCDSATSGQPSHFTRKRSGDATSDHGSKDMLNCDKPSCTARGPFLNQSELRRHKGKHTRPYPCNVVSCTVKPFADKAGLIRHGREVHGVKADGNAAPDFHCLVPGCKRGSKGFSRQHNLDQHHRRMHTRPIQRGGLQLPLPGTEKQGTTDHVNEMESSESTESTPAALGKSTEMINQGNSNASAYSGQQLPNHGTATSIPVLQAELDLLKAQKLDAVREFEDSILKLEGALAILRRGS